MVSKNVSLNQEWIQLIWIFRTTSKTLNANFENKIATNTLFVYKDSNKAINVLTFEGPTIFIFHCLSIKLDVKFLHAPIIIKTYLTNVVSMAKKPKSDNCSWIIRRQLNLQQKEKYKLRNNVIYQLIRKSRILFYNMYL